MIWAIPGFLGLPTDWHHFSKNECTAIDLCHFPWDSLFIWSSSFNRWITRQKKEKNILLGYSLGGRLALHALLQDPSLWHAAIIISTHPGLQDPTQKYERYQKDIQWAQQFIQKDWTSVLSSWNAQSAFHNEVSSFYRYEKNYQRAQLADILKNGSLGRQNDLFDSINSLSMPILWITGEKDASYCQLASQLSFSHPFSHWEKIPQSGHRVPWTQPEIFYANVKKFLRVNGL